MSFEPEKTCRTCLEPKSVGDFWRRRAAPDGLQTECKDCMGARNLRWIGNNRDRFRASNLKATHAYRQRDPLARLYAYTRNRARKQGIEFSISIDDLRWNEFCPVLGIRLVPTLGNGKGSGLSKETAPSVDRIDNTKGYVPGNVVIVSWRANRIKSDATPEELRRIAHFYGRLDSQKGGQADLPTVQSPAPEEDGALLIGVGD